MLALLIGKFSAKYALRNKRLVEGYLANPISLPLLVESRIEEKAIENYMKDKKKYHPFLHEFFCEGADTFFLEDEDDELFLSEFKDDPRYEEIKNAIRPLSEGDYLKLKDYLFGNVVKTIDFKFHNKILASIKNKENYLRNKHLSLVRRHIGNLGKVENYVKVKGKADRHGIRVYKYKHHGLSVDKRLIDSEIFLIKKYLCFIEESIIEELFLDDTSIIKLNPVSYNRILRTFAKKLKLFESRILSLNTLAGWKGILKSDRNTSMDLDNHNKVMAEILNFIKHTLDNRLKRMSCLLAKTHIELYKLEGALPRTGTKINLLRRDKNFTMAYGKICTALPELEKAINLLNRTKKRFEKVSKFLTTGKCSARLIKFLFRKVLNKAKTLIKNRIKIYRKKGLILDKAVYFKAKEQYRSLILSKSFNEAKRGQSRTKKILIKVGKLFIDEITKRPRETRLGLDRAVQIINCAEGCYGLAKVYLSEVGLSIKKKALIKILITGRKKRKKGKGRPFSKRVFKDIKEKLAFVKQDVICQVYYEQFIL